MKYGKLICKMSLEEKAKLCVGKDYWNSENIERLNIQGLKMSDGPHGLRVQKEKADNLGINESEISTCFPSSATLANSWNKKMAFKLGDLLGKEASYQGIDIVLGPAINIKRNPLCGRNFEYFSEDPYLTGVLGSEYVKGLQKNNVGACVKHFAANNQENRRRTINTVVDERTLREIYLKAFEMIVKDAKPWSIMSAYNKVNGRYCTENKVLIDILKKEWNFDGIVITDWGAENNRVEGLIAGNEIEMPGGRGNGKDEIIQAINEGRIKEEYLDEIVDRILEIYFRAEKRNNLKKYDPKLHHKIAKEIAEDSIVLLKNDDKILPIDINKVRKIALIGDMAKNPRYQGAGSSTINPYKIENIYDCFIENNIKFEYTKGYNRIDCKEDKELLNEAIKIASRNDIVIICAGLTENFESEGMDRNSLDISKNQNKLIEEICKINKNIIVVLSNGSPILMNWKNNVKAIITGYLGGESGAKAMYNCLTGIVNPSGKLAETYPLKLEDVPSNKNYPGTEVSVEYKESIFVGYRYFDTRNIDVLYPFGFGMSYTEFEYSDLKVINDIKCDENVKNKNINEGSLIVSFKVKNIGKVKGKEIIQIYIMQENPSIFKPKKELKGFEKVELNPDEEKEILIKLGKDAFEYYNIELKKWAIEEGSYKILVGKSSKDIELEEKIYLSSKDEKIKAEYSEKYKTGNVEEISDEEFEKLLGYKIPDRYLKLEDISSENTLEQLKDTNVGKAIYANQMEKLNSLMQKQDVNKATKVMMDMQKPLKKFYEKKGSKYTKEMIDEFLYISKNNLEYENNEFYKLYTK